MLRESAVQAGVGHQSLVVVCLDRPPGGFSQDFCTFLDSMQDCLDLNKRW